MMRRSIVFAVKKYSDGIAFFIIVLPLPDTPDECAQENERNAEAGQGEKNDHAHEIA